jgi:hypothetical protein
MPAALTRAAHAPEPMARLAGFNRRKASLARSLASDLSGIADRKRD